MSNITTGIEKLQAFRIESGQRLFNAGSVSATNELNYLIKSDSQEDVSYKVILTQEYRGLECDCKDFQSRGKYLDCKHIQSVRFYMGEYDLINIGEICV